MGTFRIILIFIFSLILINNAQSFTDSDGKGAQSDGRDDSSFLKAKNSNFKKGKDALNQALKYEKKNKVEKANKRFNDSIDYFLLANEEFPKSIEILNYLGFTYYKVGDLIMSEIYYLEGLNLDPKNNQINEHLGKLYLNTKRINLAKERLEVLNSCNCKEYTGLKNLIDKN